MFYAKLSRISVVPLLLLQSFGNIFALLIYFTRIFLISTKSVIILLTISFFPLGCLMKTIQKQPILVMWGGLILQFPLNRYCAVSKKQCPDWLTSLLSLGLVSNLLKTEYLRMGKALFKWVSDELNEWWSHWVECQQSKPQNTENNLHASIAPSSVVSWMFWISWLHKEVTDHKLNFPMPVIYWVAKENPHWYYWQ